MAWLAVCAGAGALLTGCGGSEDGPSDRALPPATTAPEDSASAGDSRNPTSAELDFTWYPDGDTLLAPLGFRHGEAMMPTVNSCLGEVTFGAEVTVSFPCGTDRAQGTARVNDSADRLTIAWSSGVTDTFVKRADLTIPDPVPTGLPDGDDLDRQVDAFEDLLDEMARDTQQDLSDLPDLPDLTDLPDLSGLVD